MGATGLLLVHGIGSQSRASVLTMACDELVGWLRDRYGDDAVIYGPTQLRLGEDDSSGPPTTRIDIRGCASIVVAESRWAESFIAPSYGRITGWLLMAVVRATRHEVGNLLGRLTAPDPPDTGGPFAPGRPYPPSPIARISHAFFLLAALPLLLTVIPATAVLRIFPPARGAVTMVQRVLSATIGDAYVFCQDLTGRAAIVQQVRRDVEYLSTHGVDRIVVAAHSQGAAVSYEALSSCTERHAATDSCSRCSETVDLLTYGSGLDKLTAISGPMTRAFHDLVATVGSGLFACTSLVALGFAIGDVLGHIDEQSGVLHVGQELGFARACASDCGRETAQAVALTIAAASVVLGLLILLVWAGATRTLLVGRFPWRRIFVAGLILVICLRYCGLIVVSPQPSILAAMAAALSLALGFGLLRYPASDNMLIPRPERVETWIDVRASADPVASSALGTTGDRTDLVIHNRRSVALDHTTYWRNWAEFVPIVLNTLALDGGPDVGVPRAWLARERSRLFELTWMLSGVRIFMMAAFGALLIAVITDLPAVGGWIVDRYADAAAVFGNNGVGVDSQLARTAIAVAAVGVLTAAAYLLFVAGWKGWQRARRRRRVGELKLFAETADDDWGDWRAFARCRRHGDGTVAEGWLAVRCGPPGTRTQERIWVADDALAPGDAITVAPELRGCKWWRRRHLHIREVGTDVHYVMLGSRARMFLLLVAADAGHR